MRSRMLHLLSKAEANPLDNLNGMHPALNCRYTHLVEDQLEEGNLPTMENIQSQLPLGPL